MAPPRKPRRAPDPRLFHVDLHSYGEVSRSRSEVYHPATVEELRVLLAELSASGERRVTFRAGGCSLDAQSLNDDVVIFLDRLDEIVVRDDPAEPTVTVGAGARWGDIARALEAVGLVPFVAVSTSRATAGGTASADCISRFSSSIGKESTFIRQVSVLTLDGVLHEVSRDSASADDRALFHAVIGGFGYLGVIVRLTYAVWRPPAPGFPRTPLRVSTLVKKCGDLRSFVRPLADHAPRPAPRAGKLGANTTYALHDIAHGFFERAAASAAEGSPDDPTAFYGVVCPGGAPRGLVFESRYVRSDTLRPMLQHVPAHPLRFLAEWTARGRHTGPLFWWATYEMFDEAPYLDDLLGYTFFMDGNVRTRALERRLGMTTFTLQQTYVIPFSPEALREFLSDALELLDARGLVPLLFDVLYIPGDDALLSASRRLDGFAVTLAFETGRRSDLPLREDALRELSHACLAAGGRVHLGKTVCATPGVLRGMYAGALGELRSLKDRYDPKRVLGNRFLEERFPELLAPAVAPG
ncbi:MAG TPA: FAD-binding oxidoreductase [Polyangiaceae bacterium]|nr:FAD-binding oxidoreductase [Polyangiaceae bacterium]